MNIKQLLMVLWGGIVLAGCGRPSPSAGDSFTWHIDPSAARKMDLAQIVDSIFLVPLETGDSCLIKKIRAVEYAEGKYYVNNDFTDIQVYDSLGHFLYSTRKCKGIGPNDYRTVLGFTRLPHDTLELFDAMAKKMHYYVHPEGLVKSTSLPSDVLPAGEYAWLNGDTCVFAEGSPDNPVLKFYSRSRGTLFKVVEDRQKSTFMLTSHCLYRFDGMLYYTPAYPSNGLYVLDENLDKKKVLQLDFGKHNFSMDDLPADMNLKQVTEYWDAHPELVYPLTKCVLDSLYLVFFQFEGSLCVAAQDRSTGRTVVLRNEAGSKPQLMMPDYAGGGKLCCAVAPEYLPYAVDTALMSPSDVARLERVKADDNPVLVVYRLKHF